MALFNGITSSVLRKMIFPPSYTCMSTSACNYAQERTYDNNKLVLREFKSRNPRNLELMRIAYKPEGYALDKPGRAYWNKLEISFSRHSVRGHIVHVSGVVVVSASSAEWGIKKQLYRYSDSCAFKAVGAVLAARAQECGLREVFNNYTAEEGTKVDLFLKALQSGGLKLEESDRFRKPNIFDSIQPTPPWDELNIV